MKNLVLFLAVGALGVNAFAGNTNLPHKDSEFGCLDSNLADRYIHDLNININSFGGKEVCNPEKDGKKIITDIYLIENGAFVQSGNSNTFIRGNVDPKNYYHWLVQNTRGMKRGNDVPYATAYNSFGYFTFQDGWATLSTLGRVGTIIHEARHTEGYRHIPCNQGSYAGSSIAGCDTSLAQGGSHGVEMEYYANVVVNGNNFHPAYQSMARLMCLGRSNIFFNENPMRVREGLALIDQQTNEPILLDGDHQEVRTAPAAVSGYTIKRTSAGAVLFKPDSKPLAIDFYSTDQGTEELEDGYSYYKLLNRSDSGALRLNDYEEFDVGVKRFVVGLNQNTSLYQYEFPNGKWGNPIALPSTGAGIRFATTSPQGQKGLYLVNKDGQLFAYDPAQQSFARSPNGQYHSDAITYVSFKNQTLMLSQDGSVYLVNAKGDLSPYPIGSPHLKFSQMVSIPLYDAYEVRP